MTVGAGAAALDAVGKLHGEAGRAAFLAWRSSLDCSVGNKHDSNLVGPLCCGSFCYSSSDCLLTDILLLLRNYLAG